MSICWTSSPRAAPTSRAWPTAHSTSTSEQARPTRRQVAVDDVEEQHPAAGPVVDAPPRPDLAVRVADHDVLPGPQAALGDLDQHVVSRRRPSRGRAARGRAAGGSAGRRRTGRPGRACRPPTRGSPRLLDQLRRGRARTGCRRGSRRHCAPARDERSELRAWSACGGRVRRAAARASAACQAAVTARARPAPRRAPARARRRGRGLRRAARPRRAARGGPTGPALGHVGPAGLGVELAGGVGRAALGRGQGLLELGTASSREPGVHGRRRTRRARPCGATVRSR